jgi:hypothetical protein
MSTGRAFIGLAEPYFTLRDEQAGYPETRKRLAGYDDQQLIDRYLESKRDGFNRLFGHHARKFGDLVTDELLARGITQIPNIFGPIDVKHWSAIWDERI